MFLFLEYKSWYLLKDAVDIYMRVKTEYRAQKYVNVQYIPYQKQRSNIILGGAETKHLLIIMPEDIEDF